MKDDFLYKFQKPPRREFADDLYKRIQKPMKTPIRTPLLRSLAIGLTVMAVLIGAMFALPPARAFAESLMRQIGIYTFVQGEPHPDATKQALNQQDDAKKQSLQGEGEVDQKDKKFDPEQDAVKAEKGKGLLGAPDTAAASDLAGFEVMAPTYLPEGYTAHSEWIVDRKENVDNIASVSIGFQNTTHDVFVINEVGPNPNSTPQIFEVPEIQDVTVRGQPGVWVPGGKPTLAWVENGITISISSNGLSLDETLKIAEGMGK